MPDAKHLLFASDRSDGMGGFDIWSANLDASGNIIAGSAKNLGAPVNSKYDEQAPYYHAASSSLVFSSNGNVGMGGFDFFQSTGNLGGWSNPENLGYPLNSAKDDIYFTSNGTAKNMLADVLFSSDRSSECCLEMFALNKVRPMKQISGTVVDCDGNTPLPWVSLTITNEANQVIETRSTGTDGKYSFELEDFVPMNITAKLEGYADATIAAKAEANNQLINQEIQTICLNKIKPDTIPPPPPIDTVVVMNNIYFDFDKAIILPQSFEYIDAQIFTMLKRYPTMVLEISGHTDDMGSNAYNLDLSQQRANAVKYYLEAKGIAPERLTAIGFGETKPIAPNKINGKDNPEGRKKNRRTEFKVLHY
jgi:outer membrane protein OmpA-like peptidoglycan-associated protein